MKICRTCRVEKESVLFHRDKTKPGGLHGDCKACRKIRSAEYHAKHRARLNEKSKIYHAQNLAACRARDVAYRLANIEQVRVKDRERRWKDIEATREKDRARYARNKDRVSVQRAVYYERNKEKVKISTKRHRDENPTKFAGYRILRIARKKKATIGNQTAIQAWTQRWKAKNTVRCYWCQGSFSPKTCHTDHVVALTKGGPHSIENLCVSCKTCNLKKQAKRLESWNLRITQPVLL